MAINSPIQGGIQAVRNTVSSSLFSGRAVPPPQPDPVTTNLLTQNTASLNSVSQQLGGVSQSLSQLRFSLSVVKNNLDVRSQLERQRVDAESERERRLATLRLREGKESTIEQKIQNALMSPVSKIGTKVQGILGKLRGAFNVLFYGWLGEQALEAYDAVANKNKKAQVNIGFKVAKVLGAIVLTIGTIKFGWKNLIGGFTGLAMRLFKFKKTSQVWNPIKGVVNVVKRSLEILGGLAIWDWATNKEEDMFLKPSNWERNFGGNNNTDNSDANDPQENRSIFGRGLGFLFGGSAKASDNNVSQPQSKIIPSKANESTLASQPKKNNKDGNWFTKMFNRKNKTPEQKLSEQFKQSYTNNIEQGYNSNSTGDESYFNSLEGTTAPMSGSLFGNSENISSVKRSPQVSEQLASLPDEEPIIIPSGEGQSNQGSSSPGGSVLPGSASEAVSPIIDAINPDNTYVYHAYQQFNLTPV